MSKYINHLVYLLIFVVFCLEYLQKEFAIIPQVIKHSCDLLSIITMAVAVVVFGLRKKFYLPIKYIYIFYLIILTIISSVLINNLGAKEIIFGIRRYFKPIPFFILPAVYSFSDSELRKQLKLIMFILILQLPITVYQRFIQYKGVPTGDIITGTLLSSGTLSIVLICALCILYYAYLVEVINLRKFIILAIILFLPTTLNETKVTLIILPLAFGIPFFSEHRININLLKNMLILGVVGSVMVFAFIKMYDLTMGSRKDFVPVTDMIQDRDKLEWYLFGTKAPKIDGNVRRGNAILFALDGIKNSMGQLFFGKGIGSIVKSKYRTKEEIEYYFQRGAEKMTLTQLLWEMGVLGTLLFFSIFIMIFNDIRKGSVYLSNFNYFVKGWKSVTIIILITAMLYGNILVINIYNFAFWFYSGVVISKLKHSRIKKVYLE